MRSGTDIIGGSFASCVRGALAIGLALALSLPCALAGSTYQNSYCDAFCDQLVDVKSGKVLGLNGQDGWTAADDEACSLAEGATPTPTPLAQASPVPAVKSKTQAFQCQWHAGQALNYCEAYVLPQQSAGFQKVLLTLDMAAAATCWTACVDPFHTMEAVCSYASMGVGATEFIDSFVMKSSGLGKAINAAVAAGDAASGALAMGAARSAASASQAAAAIGPPSVTIPGSTFTDPATGKVIFKGPDMTLDNPNKAQAEQADAKSAKANKHAQHMSCFTAALMTVTAVMRMRDMKSGENTQQNACNSIQQLVSTAPPINTANPGSTVGSASGGGGLPPPGAMAQANGPLGNGKEPSPACAANGLGAGGCGFTPAQLSAPDAQILNSGLGQAVAAQAAQQQPAIMSALSSGDPGGAVGQALAGGAPNSDVAKAISTLAAKAASAPSALNDKSGEAGGGGGGSDQQAQSAGLGFGMDNNAPLPGAAEATFTAPAARAPTGSGDVFHSNFKGSIFQIISQRMNAIRGQVAQLPWSTPLNRALAGDAAPSSQGVAQ